MNALDHESGLGKNAQMRNWKGIEEEPWEFPFVSWENEWNRKRFQFPKFSLSFPQNLFGKIFLKKINRGKKPNTPRI